MRITKNKYDYLFVGDRVRVDNALYFTNVMFNAIYRHDLHNQTHTCIGQFENEKTYKENIYWCVEYSNNKLIFLDCFAQAEYLICMFDLQTNEQQYYIKNTERIEMAGFTINGTYAYLIPRIPDCYWKVNLETGDYCKEKLDIVSDNLAIQMCGVGTSDKEYIYIYGYPYTNKIYLFDKKNCQINVKTVGAKENKISSLSVSDEGILTVDEEHNTIVLLNDSMMEEIHVPEEIMKTICRAVWHNDKIYIVSNTEYKIVVYNYKTKKYIELPLEAERINQFRGGVDVRFSVIEIVEQSIVFMPYGLNRGIVVDNITDEVSYWDAALEERVSKYVKQKILCENVIPEEKDGIALQDWIGFL